MKNVLENNYMTLINGKVVLLIGGTRLITEALARHFMEKGVGAGACLQW